MNNNQELQERENRIVLFQDPRTPTQIARRTLLSRLPTLEEQLNSLTIGMRMEVMLDIAEYAAEDPDEFNILYKPPICDGRGFQVPVDEQQEGVPRVPCTNTKGIEGVFNFLKTIYQNRNLNDHARSEWPIPDSQVGAIQAYRELTGLQEGNIPDLQDPQYIEGQVLAVAVNQIHTIHRYGFDISLRAGYDLAKSIFLKRYALACMMLRIPMANARSVEVSTSEVEAWSAVFLEAMLYYVLIVIRACMNLAISIQYVSTYIWQATMFHCSSVYKASAEWSWRLGLHHYVQSKTRKNGDNFAVVNVDDDEVRRYVVAHAVCYLIIVLLFWRLVPAISRVALGCIRRVYEVLSVYSRVSRRRLTNLWHEKIIKVIGSSVLYREIYVPLSKAKAPQWIKLTENPIMEMSMSGSDFCKAKYTPGILTLFIERLDDSGNLINHQIGMAFRYKHWLVTAAHVLEMVERLEGTLYLAPFAKSPHGSEIAYEKKTRLDIDVDSNCLPAGEAQRYDLAAIDVGDPFFSNIGVSSVKPGSATWGIPVSTFGLVEKNDLFFASGSVLVSQKDSGLSIGRIAYCASTRSGWSGCPVINGKKIVAMHQLATKEKNIGLDFAVIIHLLEKYTEKNMLDYDFYWDKVEQVLRDSRGREVWTEEDEFGSKYLVDSRSGRREAFVPDYFKDWEDEREAVEEMRPHERREYFASGQGSSKLKRLYKENGMNVLIPEMHARFEDYDALPAHEPRSPTKFRLKLEDNSVMKVDSVNHKVVRTTQSNTRGVRNKNLVDKFILSAEKIGYTEGEYLMPKMENQQSAQKAVEISSKKHFDKYIAKCDRKELDLGLRSRARRITSRLLKHNRYSMVKDPLSESNIEDIINSSRIDSSKNPGFPFIAEGLTNNGDVIARGNLNGLVRSKAFEGQHCNVFGKMEPHKKRKIDESMVRLIAGVSLIDRVSNEAYFGKAYDVMIANYKKSPILGGWSPLVPGAGEWFYKNLDKPKTLKYSHDIKGFEESINDEDVEDSCSILVSLATRAAGMTPEEETEWRAEAKRIAKLQFKLPFRLPSGTLVERLKEGRVTSGSLLTFIFNSITNLNKNVQVLLGMGYTEDDIQSKFNIKVGGDDSFISAPIDFDHEKFGKGWAELGYEIHDQITNESMEGMEFFSWKFSKDSAGSIKWIPTRFCKYVESVRNTEYDHLPEALISHMRNWAFDEDKFEFFKSIYIDGNEENPEMFALSNLVDRYDIIDHMNGFESGIDVPLLEPTWSMLADNVYKCGSS